MIKKRKEKNTSLQRNPLMFYMTNWGFVERPAETEAKNEKKR